MYHNGFERTFRCPEEGVEFDCSLGIWHESQGIWGNTQKSLGIFWSLRKGSLEIVSQSSLAVRFTFPEERIVKGPRAV